MQMNMRPMPRSTARPLYLGVSLAISTTLSACGNERSAPLQTAEAAGTLVERAAYAPPLPPPQAMPVDSASVAYDRCIALYQERELLQQRRVEAVVQGTAPGAASASASVATDTAGLGVQVANASERYVVCRWGYSTFSDPRPLP